MLGCFDIAPMLRSVLSQVSQPVFSRRLPCVDLSKSQSRNLLGRRIRRQLILICYCCSLDHRRWIRRRGKPRYLYCCQSESPASFLVETCGPNKPWTTINSVDG